MDGGGTEQVNGNWEVCEELTPNKSSMCLIHHDNTGLENHMQASKPYQIYGDGEQRYVVATRPIEEGTVILQELPLVIGPNKTRQVCLGCLKFLDTRTSYPCTKCGWRLCSLECQFNPVHRPECYYLSKNEGDAIIFRGSQDVHLIHLCILILRCLYHKEHFPSVWEKINGLKSHYWERKKSKNYENVKKAVYHTLYCFGLKNEFTVDQIMKVWSICLTNKNDVPISTPYPAAIYELSSMFEHNCWANCYKTVDSQGVLRVIAGVSIPKGKRLSICYTNPLWTTSCRKSHLEEIFLKCKCERCMDITERLTCMSAVNCYKSTCSGILLPISFENPKLDWECSNRCSDAIPWNSVHMLLKNLMEELGSLKIRNDCHGMKMCLEKNKKFLSKWHSCVIQAQLVLLEMLGGLTTESMCTISIEDLSLKESLCEQLIEILRVIAPAEKKIIGVVYYNLHLALEEMYRRKVLSGEAAQNGSQGCVKDILNEVVKCLKYESAITKEGWLCTMALRKLNSLDNIVYHSQH